MSGRKRAFSPTCQRHVSVEKLQSRSTDDLGYGDDAFGILRIRGVHRIAFDESARRHSPYIDNLARTVPNRPLMVTLADRGPGTEGASAELKVAAITLAAQLISCGELPAEARAQLECEDAEGRLDVLFLNYLTQLQSPHHLGRRIASRAIGSLLDQPQPGAGLGAQDSGAGGLLHLGAQDSGARLPPHADSRRAVATMVWLHMAAGDDRRDDAVEAFVQNAIGSGTGRRTDALAIRTLGLLAYARRTRPLSHDRSTEIVGAVYTLEPS